MRHVASAPRAGPFVGAALLALMILSMLGALAAPAHAAEAGAAAEARLRIKAVGLVFALRSALVAAGVTNVSDSGEIQAKLGVNATTAAEIARLASLSPSNIASMGVEELQQLVEKLMYYHHLVAQMIEKKAARTATRLAEELRARLALRVAAEAEKLSRLYNDTRLAELAAQIRAAVKEGNVTKAVELAREAQELIKLHKMAVIAKQLDELATPGAVNVSMHANIAAKIKHDLKILEHLVKRVEKLRIVTPAALAALAKLTTHLEAVNTSVGVAAETGGNATAALEALAAVLEARAQQVLTIANATNSTTAGELAKKALGLIENARAALAEGKIGEAARLLALAKMRIVEAEAAIRKRIIMSYFHEMRGRYTMPELDVEKLLRKFRVMPIIIVAGHGKGKAGPHEEARISVGFEAQVNASITATEALIARLEAKANASNAAKAMELLERAREYLGEAKAHLKAALEAKARGDMETYMEELGDAWRLSVKARALAAAAAAMLEGPGKAEQLIREAERHAERLRKHLKNILGNLTNMTLPWMGHGEEKGKEHGKGGGKSSHEEKTGGRHGAASSEAARTADEVMAQILERLEETRIGSKHSREINRMIHELMSLASQGKPYGDELRSEILNLTSTMIEELRSSAEEALLETATAKQMLETIALSYGLNTTALDLVNRGLRLVPHVVLSLGDTVKQLERAENTTDIAERIGILIAASNKFENAIKMLNKINTILGKLQHGASMNSENQGKAEHGTEKGGNAKAGASASTSASVGTNMSKELKSLMKLKTELDLIYKAAKARGIPTDIDEEYMAKLEQAIRQLNTSSQSANINIDEVIKSVRDYVDTMISSLEMDAKRMAGDVKEILAELHNKTIAGLQAAEMLNLSNAAAKYQRLLDQLAEAKMHEDKAEKLLKQYFEDKNLTLLVDAIIEFKQSERIADKVRNALADVSELTGKLASDASALENTTNSLMEAIDGIAEGLSQTPLGMRYGRELLELRDRLYGMTSFAIWIHTAVEIGDAGATPAAKSFAEKLKKLEADVHSAEEKAEKLLDRIIGALEKETQEVLANATRLEDEVGQLRLRYAGNTTAQQMLDEAMEHIQKARSEASNALALINEARGASDVVVKARLVAQASFHFKNAYMELGAAARIVAQLEAGSGSASAQGGGEAHGGARGGLPMAPATP